MDNPAPNRIGSFRRFLRPAATLGFLGFAVHLLLPRVAELSQGFSALRSGRWPYLILTVVASGMTFLAGAWMVRASVERPPPWRRTTLIQVAASAAAIVTPMGLGWAAVNQSYLQRRGVDESTSVAATALNMLLTFAAHIALLVIMLPLLPALSFPSVSPPQRRVFVDGVVIGAVVAGAAVWIPRVRTRLMSSIRPILAAIPSVLGDPRRSFTMLGAAVATNLLFGFGLYGAVAAFGTAPPPVGVLVVYLFAATVAAIAPTPGGLGAFETALVAGLTRISVEGGQAVAAALAFRLASFWLPLGVGAIALQRARKRRWV